jgi:hypothetical protein
MDITLAGHEISELSLFLATSVMDLWLIPKQKTDIAFKPYCQRLLKSTRLGRSAVLYALEAMTRFVRMYPRIILVGGSHYRLTIITLMTSTKLLDDHTFTNKTWSFLTGKSIHEINCMEVEYLNCIHHEMALKVESFENWLLLFDCFRLQQQVEAHHHQLKSTTTQELDDALAISRSNRIGGCPR